MPPAIPLTPCKGQKLLAQGIRPGYLCPHAWRPERAKALYGTRGRRLRPALSPVSVSLSPVFGVIAGFLYLYRRFLELSPVKFVITPLYSYSYPFLFYVPDEGGIPILFPFLGGIHHGVDFLAQFPSEFGQRIGDVVIIVSHEFLLIQYDKDIPVTILPGGTSGLRAEKYRLSVSRHVLSQAFTDSSQNMFLFFLHVNEINGDAKI